MDQPTTTPTATKTAKAPRTRTRPQNKELGMVLKVGGSILVILLAIGFGVHVEHTDHIAATATHAQAA
jgi:preprotein translocase subunit Sss1